MSGYLTQPSLWGGEKLAFVAEGDIWVTKLLLSIGQVEGEVHRTTDKSQVGTITCDSPYRLTTQGECAWPCFSPDGATIAFARETQGFLEEVCVVPIHGGTSRVLHAFAGIVSVRGWTADGSHVIVAVDSQAPAEQGSTRLFACAARADAPDFSSLPIAVPLGTNASSVWGATRRNSRRRIGGASMEGDGGGEGGGGGGGGGGMVSRFFVRFLRKRALRLRALPSAGPGTEKERLGLP